jgi:putative FmdB family regulatory protein
MPIYEYLCRKCGEFELMQRITDDPLRRCPTCHGRITKLISNTSFQLKGSGWYVTDYARKDGKGNERVGESKSDAKADQKSETKSENTASASTKPAKTKEAPRAA